MAVTSLFLNIETWLTPHFKGIFEGLSNYIKSDIFWWSPIFCEDPNLGLGLKW